MEPNKMGTNCTHLWNSACPGPKAAEQLAALVPANAEFSQAQRLAIAQLSLKALVDNIPGDFVDIGVGIGGAAAAVMVKALSAHDDETRVASSDTKADERGGARQVWVVDSFSGAPKAPQLSSASRIFTLHGLSPRVDKIYSGATITGLCDVLRRTGTLDFFRLRLVAGDYNVTLPRMPLTNGGASGNRIALLRIGSGLACSTLGHVLSMLYPRVSPGAIIYVDGYPYNGCNLAEFHQGGVLSLMPVVDDDGTQYSAVWWTKPIENGEVREFTASAFGRRRLRTKSPRERRWR